MADPVEETIDTVQLGLIAAIVLAVFIGIYLVYRWFQGCATAGTNQGKGCASCHNPFKYAYNVLTGNASLCVPLSQDEIASIGKDRIRAYGINPCTGKFLSPAYQTSFQKVTGVNPTCRTAMSNWLQNLMAQVKSQTCADYQRFKNCCDVPLSSAGFPPCNGGGITCLCDTGNGAPGGATGCWT